MQSAATDLGTNAEALVAAFNGTGRGARKVSRRAWTLLITLDPVRLAQCGAFHTAVLVAGTVTWQNLSVPAQDAGCRVVVATVGGQASLAKELAQLTDEVIHIPQDNLAAIVRSNGVSPQPDEACRGWFGWAGSGRAGETVTGVPVRCMKPPVAV